MKKLLLALSLALLGANAYSYSASAWCEQEFPKMADGPAKHEEAMKCFNRNHKSPAVMAYLEATQAKEEAYYKANRPTPAPISAPAQSFGDYTGIDNILQKYSPQVPMAVAPKTTNCYRSGNQINCTTY